jgi:hypothetical protein
LKVAVGVSSNPYDRRELPDKAAPDEGEKLKNQQIGFNDIYASWWGRGRRVSRSTYNQAHANPKS